MKYLRCTNFLMKLSPFFNRINKNAIIMLQRLNCFGLRGVNRVENAPLLTTVALPEAAVSLKVLC